MKPTYEIYQLSQQEMELRHWQVYFREHRVTSWAVAPLSKRQPAPPPSLVLTALAPEAFVSGRICTAG